MPLILRYGCDSCDFAFPIGWGGYMYAVDDDGERALCGHPGEDQDAQRITGMSFTDANACGRIGYAQHAACRVCCCQFDLDPDKDARQCPECFSPEITFAREAVGQSCPKCHRGVIEKGSPIRWDLDPDWERLPVPAVVKDIVEYRNTYSIAPSLQRADHAASEIIGEHGLDIPTIFIIKWWEGEYPNGEQVESFNLKSPKLEKAINAILGVTPELAEIMTCSSLSCSFSASLGVDVRRGIKNYVRKHLDHVAMS